MGWNRVSEQQSLKGTEATLPLYRWETEALRWEQIAQPQALLCSDVAVGPQ